MNRKREKLKKIGALILVFVLSTLLIFVNNSDEAYAADSAIYKGVDYSKVFDYDYYYNMYEDLQKNIGYNKSALLRHFVECGMKEGRIAKQSFNVQFYKNKYGDLRTAFGNDLKKYYIHYINFGKKEKRVAASETVYLKTDYAVVYNKGYYYNKNKSVLSSVGYDSEKLITHFVKYGMSQGLRASEDFDVKYYQYKYSDLKKAFGNNYKMYYVHYLQYGKKEGRTPMSTAFYKGVDYSNVYSKDYYYHNNPDLQKAFGYDTEKLITHFISFGMNEGRQAKLEFSPSYYKNHNADLRAAFGSKWKSYYEHYMTFGIKEKRKGNSESNYNGWNVVKGDKIYYQNGQFLKGWQTIGGRKYYFSDTGALKSKTGIDVSQHQGKIDWEQVKKDGVEFAIIRLGYGMDLKKQDDTYAIYNMTECERLNIPYGVYMFSYATKVGGTKGVVSEIAHTLRLLQGRKPSVGVFIDVEQDSYKNANPVPSGATVSSICLEFNKQLSAAGYKTGTYTNTYFYDTMVTNDELDKYSKWLADYYTDSYDTDTYMMWQYSSKGSVAGIGGNVDMDIMVIK